MQIQPATCPACGAAYDPLRAQAVMVIDGRVRAFCSAPCRERGLAPPSPKRSATDTHTAISLPVSSSFVGALPTEQRVLVGTATVALAAFVLLISLGKHENAAPALVPLAASVPSAAPARRPAVTAGDASDVWLQPLASVARPLVKHDARLFLGREGLRADECAGARCSVEIAAAPGAVVMAVHDGVIEAVERAPVGRLEGRSIRINHRGGAVASSYFQLDGIREDLKPGIPVKAGEPIATVARSPNASSRAHLRFAMSVVASADGAMLFIDPQPLLALWPIRHDSGMSLRGMEHAQGAVEDEANDSRTADGRADPLR